MFFCQKIKDVNSIWQTAGDALMTNIYDPAVRRAYGGQMAATPSRPAMGLATHPLSCCLAPSEPAAGGETDGPAFSHF
jgi:hypothetical protein